MCALHTINSIFDSSFFTILTIKKQTFWTIEYTFFPSHPFEGIMCYKGLHIYCILNFVYIINLLCFVKVSRV